MNYNFDTFHQDASPHFIAEYNVQQVRKLVLEMIQRLPANDYLKPHAKSILLLTFKLLEYENEDNVLVISNHSID